MEYTNPLKVYVEVIARFTLEGTIVPISFIWEDQQEYIIDEIIMQDKKASIKAGGIGNRYLVSVNGKKTNLWLENYDGKPRFFMERK